MLIIDRVVVNTTLRIDNKIYSETVPGSSSVERLLALESLTQNYLTLSLKFLVGQIIQTIILKQTNIDK